MTLTALPPRQEATVSNPLHDMVMGAQLTNNAELRGIDADALKIVVDECLTKQESTELAKLVRNVPADALAGLCRNLLDPTLDVRAVAHNTMYLFDVLSMSYYYSARPANYTKIHRVIADTHPDLTTVSVLEAATARTDAIARLCIHVSPKKSRNLSR